MIHRTGNMWEAVRPADLTFVTTNSFIKGSGELVMGRGAAQIARDMYPGLSYEFGRRVTESCGHLGTYGIIFSEEHQVGGFQTKQHWRDPSKLHLINNAVAQLSLFIERHPGMRVSEGSSQESPVVHLNYPGIGYGQLSILDVEPLLGVLPNSVHVWRYK